MFDPYFFGYGSLVNRHTHDYPETRPARVKGWRRQWRHTALRDVAYLSVAKAPGHTIEGLIAVVPDGNWAALDQREHAYDRLPLDQADIHHDHPGAINVQMYRTKPGNDAPPSVRHPILQSYLDTVLLGYLEVFGEQGVADFIATTDGWDSPILADRDNPLYPRAVSPDPRARRLIDGYLEGASRS